MKTIENSKEKRMYSCPVIVYIELDNEISLSLESTPPIGPDEGYSIASEHIINDPFKTNWV